MAFVDLSRDRLVLKVILAGPPAVGKTTRLLQIGEEGRSASFGRTALGPQRMASMPLETQHQGRPVEVEVYEWHGPERADVRSRGLFVGLDGLVYLADAREDRRVDTDRQLELLVDTVGKSRMRRLPGLLVLGRKDEGLTSLSAHESSLARVEWSLRFDGPIEDAAGFLEAFRLYGEVMLARTV